MKGLDRRLRSLERRTATASHEPEVLMVSYGDELPSFAVVLGVGSVDREADEGIEAFEARVAAMAGSGRHPADEY